MKIALMAAALWLTLYAVDEAQAAQYTGPYPPDGQSSGFCAYLKPHWNLTYVQTCANWQKQTGGIKWVPKTNRPNAYGHFTWKDAVSKLRTLKRKCRQKPRMRRCQS